MNYFSIRLWCATKSGFYTTTSNVQLSGWTEKKLQSTSQNHICIKNTVMVIVGWSTADLIFYRFLNFSKTITSEEYTQQLDEMHQKWQCLQPALVNRKPNSSPRWHPTTPCTTNTSKVKRTVLRSFASFVIVMWSLTNWLPLLQISKFFCREIASTTIRRQKVPSNSLLNPETWIFMQQNKQTFLVGKNVLIATVPV